jgi:SAM-dependent methyltransferase
MKPTDLSARQIMNRIYKDICGFEIQKVDEQEVRKSNGSPVYGEINQQSLQKLFSLLDLTSHDVFFDLGSGVGKVILHAALFTPVKRAVGIELSKDRHQQALIALKKASFWAKHIHERCEFIHDNLMNVDLSSATVIYTCSTAFSIRFMKEMSERLAQLNHDFRFITLQDLPSEKNFVLIDKIRLDMSWVRKTPVYIYRMR